MVGAAMEAMVGAEMETIVVAAMDAMVVESLAGIADGWRDGQPLHTYSHPSPKNPTSPLILFLLPSSFPLHPPPFCITLHNAG